MALWTLHLHFLFTILALCSGQQSCTITMQSYGANDALKVAFIEVNGDRAGTFNIIDAAGPIYVSAIITPDCQLLEDAVTIPADLTASFDPEGTDNLAGFLDEQITKALAVEGHVAVMSVHGRGDLGSLNDVSSTPISQLEAIMEQYHVNYTASDSESGDVIGGGGDSVGDTWIFVINVADPDSSKNKVVRDKHGPRIVEYIFTIDDGLTYSCVERLKEPHVYNPRLFGVSPDHPRLVDNQTLLHLETQRTIQCPSTGVMFGWEYVVEELVEFDLSIYEELTGPEIKQRAGTRVSVVPVATDEIQFQCLPAPVAVVNGDTFGIVYPTVTGDQLGVLRVPGFLGAEQYPCAEVITSRTAGVMALIAADTVDLSAGTYDTGIADFTDPTGFTSARIAMSFKPIVLSAGVFAYTCPCTTGSVCNPDDEHLLCVGGKCVCENGYFYMRLRNKCALEIPVFDAMNSRDARNDTQGTNAIDANDDPNLLTGTCSVTATQAQPYLVLDLGGEYEIYAVSIKAPQPYDVMASFYTTYEPSPVSNDLVCSENVPDFEIIEDSIADLNASSGAIVTGQNTKYICIIGPLPWKVYKSSQFSSIVDSHVLNRELEPGPKGYHAADISNVYEDVAAIRKLIYFGYLVATDVAKCIGIGATAVDYDQNTAKSQCKVFYLEQPDEANIPEKWVIRNLEDDLGISFPSSTSPATLQSSMVSFELPDPSAIMSTGTILQIHTRDNCLIVIGNDLKQNDTCTQIFMLVNPLGSFTPLYEVQTVENVGTAGKTAVFSLGDSPCVEVSEVNGTTVFGGAVTDIAGGSITVKAYELTDTAIVPDSSEDAMVTLKATSEGIKNFEIHAFSGYDGTYYPPESDRTLCTAYPGHSSPGTSVLYECDGTASAATHVGIRMLGGNDRLTACDVKVYGIIILPDEACLQDSDCQTEAHPDHNLVCDNSTYPIPGQCICRAYHHYFPPADLCIDDNECRFDDMCIDVAKDAEDGMASGKCVNTLGGHFCYCEEGFEYSEAEGLCVDVDECADLNGGCEGGCVNMYMDRDQKTRECNCTQFPGMVLSVNGFSCVDDNECKLEGNFTTICEELYSASCPNDTNCPEASPNMTCVNTYGGYECICEVQGYIWSPEDGLCININECKGDNGGCQSNCTDLVPLIDNSTHLCSCSGYFEGYILNPGDNKTCIEQDECKDADAHYCDGMLVGADLTLLPYNDTNPDPQPYVSGECVNTDAGYECRCLPEFWWNSTDMRCEDVDECLNGNNFCHHNCSNLEPGYVCTCREGYELASGNIYFCEDLDECALDTPPNDQLCNNGDDSAPGTIWSTCVNTVGSYVCQCPDGYQLDNDTYLCTDINECLIDNGGCEDVCTNQMIDVDGVGRLCSCNTTGLRLSTNNVNCVDLNECTAYSGICVNGTTNAFDSGLDAVQGQCLNLDGSYLCQCPAGFIWSEDMMYCEDENECLVRNGFCTHTCDNVAGAYNCSCPDGYMLANDEYSCIDVDECSTDTDACEHQCYNSLGSYSCDCDQGYVINTDTRNCDDIDECALLNGGCEQTCNNEEGTYSCACSEGYTLMANGGCDDTDECTLGTDTCDTSMSVCVNTFPGYECECIEGYTRKENTVNECTDTDECTVYVGLWRNGGCSQDCTNTVGSYSCSCRSGFTLSNNGITCEDTNECNSAADNVCDLGRGQCNNEPGGYKCTCQGEYWWSWKDSKCIIPENPLVQIYTDLFFLENLNNFGGPLGQEYAQALADALLEILLENPTIKALGLTGINIVGSFIPGSIGSLLSFETNRTLSEAEQQLLVFLVEQTLLGVTLDDILGNVAGVTDNITVANPETGELESISSNPCVLFDLLQRCTNGTVCVGSATEPATCVCPDGLAGAMCNEVATTTTDLATTTTATTAATTKTTASPTVGVTSSTSSQTTVSVATSSSSTVKIISTNPAVTSTKAVTSSQAITDPDNASSSTTKLTTVSGEEPTSTETSTSSTTSSATFTDDDGMSSATIILVATLIPLGLLLLTLITCAALMIRRRRKKTPKDNRDELDSNYSAQNDPLRKNYSNQWDPYNYWNNFYRSWSAYNTNNYSY